MKKLFITILALGIFGISAFAQEEPQPTSDGTAKVQRPRLMEELGLTREQAQQIRKINIQRQPLLKQAQMQLRVAQRELDASIYADISNEQDVNEKVKAVQIASAELTKVKTFTEYSIRNVLTQEQLVKFRAFREKLAALKGSKQETFQERRIQIPNRKLVNRGTKQ